MTKANLKYIVTVYNLEILLNMAKYSSDSDSDRSSRHRRKHHRRSRSTSSSSSDSSAYRKKSKHSKSKRRHRSRSRSREKDRSSRSYKSSRNNSRDRDRRRYQSRRSKSYSPDKNNKKKLRSTSREKSTSRSSSSQSNVVKTAVIDKPQNSSAKDDFTIVPRIKDSVLEEINSERFVPKQFTSSAQNKQQTKSSNIVIDITADTIKIPAVIQVQDSSDSIFHTSVTSDSEARFDKWVKKLYTLRQKAIADLSHTIVT